MRKTFGGISIAEYGTAAHAADPSLLNLSQSQPQPFTRGELEKLIGPIDELIPQSATLGFCPSSGTEIFREAAATRYENVQANQIITFAGAQEAIFCALHALVEKGDHIVAIAPLYDPLVRTAEEIGCDLELITLQPQQDWQLDLEKLRAALSVKTRLLIINFPHNPTGAMIDQNTLEEIISLCRDTKTWLLSDEVFRGLEHDPAIRLAAATDLYDKALSVGVMSKAYALPGVRVGWLACKNAGLRKKLMTIKNYLSICNGLFDEHIAATALQNADKILKRNRDLITPLLEQTNTFFQQHSDHFNWPFLQAGCCGFAILKKMPLDYYIDNIRIKNHISVLPSSVFLFDQPGFRFGFGFKNNIDHIKKLLP